MELILVRHGRVAPGERAFTGNRYDQPLGELGWDQAHRLAERLAPKKIDAIYVSPLIRTRETAGPLAEKLGIDPVVREDIAEIYLGEYEGRSFARLFRSLDPIYLEFLRTRRWDAFPGAEPDDEIRARARGFLDEVAELHPEGCAVAVTHGGFINAAVAVCVGSPSLVVFSPENASITSVYLRPEPPLLVTVNETRHLDGERDPVMKEPEYAGPLSAMSGSRDESASGGGEEGAGPSEREGSPETSGEM